MTKRILSCALAASLVGLAGCEITPIAQPTDQPIPGTTTVFELYTPNPDPNRAFSVLFVPDASYGDLTVLANRQAFMNDMADVIENAYWQNQAYFNGWFFFNYYYMTASGTVTANPPAADGTFVCPTMNWPAAVNTDGAFADVTLLMHTNELRDCANPASGRASAEPTSFRTVVHESGHALFGLPDEYNGGVIWAVPPVTYNTQAACNADPANASWRNCDSETTLSGGTSWRSQGHIDNSIIMRNGGDTVWETGPADWAVMDSVYDALPGSSTVSTPSVFAPSAWSYTVPPTP